MAALEDIRKILSESKKELLKKSNVIATGIGYKSTKSKKTDELAVICSVDAKKAKKSLRTSELIPPFIQNIPTDVFPTGIIYAQQNPTGRFRPAPGGVSIGHINITAGTLGCLVKKNDNLYILSNNHVMANSNDAETGDPIVQPGPYDGGQYPEDHISNLSDFIPINFDGGSGGSTCPFAKAAAGFMNFFAFLTRSKTRLIPVYTSGRTTENLVDAAIALPLSQTDVSNEILNIGFISGSAEGILNMQIQKSGRTTGHTTGIIEQIDVTVQVSYGTNKIATFEDQLMAGAMSEGGDSGSAVLSMDNQLIGLLFAGSTTSTIINRIQNVFDLLNVTLP